MTRQRVRFSDGICRSIAAAAIAIYLLVYAKARTLLPEFVFRDAEKIQEQMAGSTTYSGTSFDAVGQLYALLGGGLDLGVSAVGACFVWFMLRRADRIGTLLVAIVLIAPCVFFNLFVASKDTIVVLMSLLISGYARRDTPVWQPLVLTLALYVAYAAFIRSYFALIVALALFAYLLPQLSVRMRALIAAIAVLLFAALPGDVYYTLLHPRDVAVDYLLYDSPYGARTSFHNLVEPISFVSFVADYLYAVARLHLPLLFAPGAKESAMQLFVVLALWPALRATQNGPLSDPVPRGRVNGAHSRLLSSLIVAHVAVSMLFEPDLGSYTRHLSSVALFSMGLLIARRDVR